MTSQRAPGTFGVNLFGSVATKDGIGRAARLNAEALAAAGVPLQVFALERPVALEDIRADASAEITDALLHNAPYGINLCQFSSRWTGTYWDAATPALRKQNYNIGFWYCEVPEIPETWAMNLAYYDEIWTASAFCQNAVARMSTVPVLAFPIPFEPVVTDPMPARADTSVLRFLFVSNCYSDAERKNALGSFRAFRDAFGTRSDVHLTLKLSNLEYASRLEQTLRLECETTDNVTLVDGYASDADIAELYRSHHVYVSLHRAEGYGLTLTDALRYGMPVICTGYSGNMEFSHMPGVTLLEYDLNPIGHERLRYMAEQPWATPRPKAAVAAFHHVASNYQTEQAKARTSAATLAKRFSKATIGEMMRRRLDLIHRRFAYRDDMADRVIVRDFDIYEA
jgi:hypothetical protein